MSEPFLGEIRMVGFNFAPRGWAFCDGQLLQISSNSALFSLFGTTYGGDGRTTFALPDLRGRYAMHPGSGPGLSTYSLGQRGGTETNTIAVNQMPSHNHPIGVYDDDANRVDAAGNVLANSAVGNAYSNQSPDETMASNAVGNTGGGQPVNNMSPFLCVSFAVALTGLFPSRN